MRALRYRGPLLAALTILVLASGAMADVFLLDYNGFDWFWPADIGQSGSCYGAVGHVTSVDASYLNFDYGTNEYTFVLDFACFSSADTFGTFAVYNYSGGVFNVYCDSLATGTTAMFGTSPPNAVSPSTWQDGDCVLGSTFNGDLTIVLDLTTGNGDVQGELTWDSGSQLGNIPVDQRDMSLTIAGVKFNPPDGPDGYEWQIDGSVFLQDPVTVKPSSWGAIKSLGGGR